ncbi:hypothetical protein NEFER03_0650 [Nematocida sp. LUAm3]|nr:hypothetical protein NEFER03_0650 [Nematocida sp. LUAm3]KAI5176395.1 hypothetical protein NEFER02_2166 [Nematocida sp. LUAm2]KAI5179316.1 hypothetical protein NEFER01_2164 [Nematocida sp. LUAm1]
MRVMEACARLFGAVEGFKEKAERGEVSEYKRIFNRTAEESKKATHAAENVDLPRIHLYIEKGKSLMEQKEVKETLKEILRILEGNEVYHQSMGDLCAPIVYSGVQLGKKKEDIIESSLVFLESFIYPLTSNGMKMYVEYERVMKNIPGYAPKVKEMEKSDFLDAPIEAGSILVWFTRILNLKDVSFVYEFLLGSPIRMSFLLFLSLQKVIRKRAEAFSGEDLKEEYLLNRIEKAKNLDKTHGKEFSKSEGKLNSTLLILGGVGLGVAVIVGIFMAIDKSTRNK